MMSEKLDWTQKLGDAFLAQQKDVMDAVQRLREKAQRPGNLKSTEQQKVIVEQEDSTTVIKIEPAKPEVVYVPTYNPTVVYGAWPYPAYPPYYYYPPGYVAGGALLRLHRGRHRRRRAVGQLQLGPRRRQRQRQPVQQLQPHEHEQWQLAAQQRSPRRGPLSRPERGETKRPRSVRRRRVARRVPRARGFGARADPAR